MSLNFFVLVYLVVKIVKIDLAHLSVQGVSKKVYMYAQNYRKLSVSPKSSTPLGTSTTRLFRILPFFVPDMLIKAP